MFSRNGWTGMLVLIALVCAVLFINETERGDAQNRPAAPPVDLSGNWKLDTGGTVVIEHLISSGSVFARFSPSLACHSDMRTTLFNSRVKVTAITSGESKMSLENNTFFACTRDKKLIDSCGISAVYSTPFRNAVVSADGSTISGERFYEWYSYDGEENGRYKNCRRDSSRDGWTQFTLTRACTPNKANQCASIERAVTAINKIIPPPVNSMPSVSFDPVKWQQTLTANQGALEIELDKLRKQFCDDEAAGSSIDKMRETLGDLQPGAAQTPTAVRAEMLKISAIDRDLKGMATRACSVSGPPPAGTDCKQLSNGLLDGLTTFFKQMDKLQAGDSPPSSEAYDQVADGLEAALDQLQDAAEEIEGTGGTGAQQYKDIQGKISKLRQLLDVWGKMKAASCLPPEVEQLLRRLAQEKRAGTEHKATCTELCSATADWYVEITGLSAQRGTFFKACSLACF